MNYLRWEVIPLLRPWQEPNANTLGKPIASGLISRGDDASPENRTPSDPITVPAAPEGAPFLLLRLEGISALGWIVTVGEPGTVPDPGDGSLDATDTAPRVLLPPSVTTSVIRSVDVRAVKPGSVFVARLWALP